MTDRVGADEARLPDPRPAPQTGQARYGQRRQGPGPGRPEDGAAGAPLRRAAARRPRQGGARRRPRLGRPAHRRDRLPHRDALPQGAEGDQLVLHARLGDADRLHRPGDHRRLPGDVLHALDHPGLRLDRPHQQRRLPRPARPRHAQVGLERDGDPDLPAHGPHLLLRRLQVPARAQLGDRRRAADPDDDDGLHRLPAALRPALLLGLGRRHQHQRHRPGGRPLPERLPARRPRARRDHALALLRDPHAARPRRDHRPDRRPHVPGGQARHHGPALAESGQAEGRRPRLPARRRGRGQRQPCAGATETSIAPHEAGRQAGIPRGVRAAEEEGQALLPLRGAEGLGDDAGRRRRDHPDVGHPRRRAGAEGGPDQRPPTCRAPSGTSSSSSSSCA